MHNKNECTLFLLVLFGEKEKFSCEVTLRLSLLAVRLVSYSHSLGVVVVRISHTNTHIQKCTVFEIAMWLAQEGYFMTISPAFTLSPL